MPFFDLGSMELLMIGIVALIVVGPKDLPKLMRAVGQVIAKAKGAARHFKSGIDEMVRQAELDEMQAKWDAHNRAIMAGDTPKADGGESAADRALADKALADKALADKALADKGDASAKKSPADTEAPAPATKDAESPSRPSTAS